MNLPWVSTQLAPMVFFSAFDPPSLPPAPFLNYLRPLGPALFRPLLALAKRASGSWAEPYDQFRSELGFSPAGNPMFEGGNSPDLTLALFSSSFGDKMPDWPQQTVITGFPFYDGEDTSLSLLPLKAGETAMVNGGGTMTGFAAVQIALLRGAQVIASAGNTFAGRLCKLGAKVTPYGEGMVERVRELAGGSPDWAVHTAQVNGTLPDLVKIVGGDPKRVYSFADRDEENIGVRTAWREGGSLRYDVLGLYAQLAAEGRFSIPVARTFPLEDWREAAEISMSKRAHGKLMLLPGVAESQTT